MDNSGYIKLQACVPIVKIGDVDFNVSQIKACISEASRKGVDCIVFPELSVTSYSCADLFQQELLLRKAEEGVREILEFSKDLNLLIAVGAPVAIGNSRFNCAVIIAGGSILGIVPKIHLPNYNEFYEKRWFESGKGQTFQQISYAGRETFFGIDLIFSHKGVRFGVEICEDLWVPNPPSSDLCMAGADVILNLSASDETIGKHDYLVSLIAQQSARCRCVYVYSSAGWGESSTDLVFSGNAMIGYDGKVFGFDERFTTAGQAESKTVDIQKLRLDRLRFNSFIDSYQPAADYKLISSLIEGDSSDIQYENDLDVDPFPFVPKDKDRLKERCEEIVNIQSYGLMRRLSAIGCKKAVVGISGGLDSTLALLVTVRAFDRLSIPRNGIIGITMPGFATTSRTHNNAWQLMQSLGVDCREIPINEAVGIHFRDIGQNPELYDATYENSQARERTQILMDFANKENAIVIGTGDMSELALGWCTYNGDHMSMYGVNASVPKTLVKYLVGWFASNSDDKTSEILKDIIETPISPELVPSDNDDIAQKTEDLVGPYELHDFFLFNFLRYSFTPEKIFRLACIAFNSKYKKEVILKWLKVFIRRFFSQQFKRSCMPDGPKVGSVSLSPRGDWRMPSDASSILWLEQLDSIIL